MKSITKHPHIKMSALAAALLMVGCTSNQMLEVKPVYKLSNQIMASKPADHYDMGKAYFERGMYGLALEAFKKEQSINRSSIRALNGIAACYDKMGRYQVAMRYYNMALRIDPDSALTLNNLGYSLMLQNKPKRAKMMFELAQKQSLGSRTLVDNQQGTTIQEEVATGKGALDKGPANTQTTSAQTTNKSAAIDDASSDISANMEPHTNRLSSNVDDDRSKATDTEVQTADVSQDESLDNKPDSYIETTETIEKEPVEIARVRGNLKREDAGAQILQTNALDDTEYHKKARQDKDTHKAESFVNNIDNTVIDVPQEARVLNDAAQSEEPVSVIAETETSEADASNTIKVARDEATVMEPASTLPSSNIIPQKYDSTRAESDLADVEQLSSANEAPDSTMSTATVTLEENEDLKSLDAAPQESIAQVAQNVGYDPSLIELDGEWPHASDASFVDSAEMQTADSEIGTTDNIATAGQVATKDDVITHLNDAEAQEIKVISLSKADIIVNNSESDVTIDHAIDSKADKDSAFITMSMNEDHALMSIDQSANVDNGNHDEQVSYVAKEEAISSTDTSHISIANPQNEQLSETRRIEALIEQGHTRDIVDATIDAPDIKTVELVESDVIATNTAPQRQDLMYGPTVAGNTLWKIASDLSTERKVDMQQMLTALAMSNPEAFIDGDIHRLRIGFMLWIPSTDEIAAVDVPSKIDDNNKQLLVSSLEVSNGNGRRGMARMISTYLEEQGARIARITNARSFDIENSVIYYKPGHYEEASELASNLPLKPKLVETNSEVYNTNIRLVIGKDLLDKDSESMVRRSLLNREAHITS